MICISASEHKGSNQATLPINLCDKTAARITPKGFFLSALCGTTTANPSRQSPFPIPKSPLGYRVGYATTDLITGNKAVCAQFKTIGVNGVYLTQIEVDTGTDTKVTASTGVKIQILDADGYKDKMYTFHKGDSKGFKTDGWYNEANQLITTANDVFFPVGTGLWFGGKAGYSIRTAGEVITTAQTFDLIAGNTMLANPYPAPVKLTSFIMGTGSDTKVTASAGVKIQILDADGYKDKMYTFHKGDSKGFKTDGWYNEANQLITADNDITFQPGDAMWFGGKAGYTVTIPSPIAQ